MSVQFFFLHESFNLRKRKALKSFIEFLFSNEQKVPGEISYVFCSDEFLLNVNRDFLNHDFYTDIITFDMSSNKKIINGDIYISIERVKENAKKFSVSIDKELHRVIFHGALHLCNYKDKSNKDKIKMRSMEDKYMKMYFKCST